MSVSSATTNPTNLSWHVTGGRPSQAPEVPSAEPSNCMQSAVQWFRKGQTPLILKIGAVALPVIATVGIGVLVGHPLLVSAIVLIPLTICALVALYQLVDKEDNARRAARWAAIEAAEVVERAAQAQEALRNIQEAVGGEEAFNRLPVLNLGNRNGPTGYLDFLQPNELTQPVMRGIDAAGRPFISLRLRSNTPPHSPLESQVFVITFFQRYRTGGLWTWGSWGSGEFIVNRNQVFGNTVRPQDLATIHQIVVERNHPQLSLT